MIKNRTAPVCADRTTITRPEHISSLFRFQQGVGVHGPNKPFSLTHRVGALGPLTVLDLTFGADTWVRCAEERPYYQVNVLAAGEMDLLHRGSSIASSPGLATVCVPHGDLHVSRWGAGTRMIALRFERSALEDALSEAVGQQLSAQIDFKRSVTTSKGPARTWMRMSSVLIQELFRTDSAISQPLVASSFVDTLIRALLLGIDHPYREMLTTRVKCSAPQTIRPAVDLIEAEPQRPLTVASLAGQCHISSRALQQSFVRYMGISPIAYLRQVRLRRAHQELLAADPSVETVASIAKRWGYTNPGRFAAAHAARYGEAPASTLHRSRQAVPGPNPS